MAGEVVVVCQSEVVGKRGLQSGVTLRDVHWVAVIGYIKQVAHGGLASLSTVVNAQLANIRDLPTEVCCRRDIEYGTSGISLDALIALYEFRGLWNHLYTNVEIVVVANDA